MTLRNTLFVRLKAETTDEQVEAFNQALGALVSPGRSNYVFGRDLRLREGNMDLAFSSDFEDVDAYHAWVADEAHHEVSETFLQPIAEGIERCLIEF